MRVSVVLFWNTFVQFVTLNKAVHFSSFLVLSFFFF